MSKIRAKTMHVWLDQYVAMACASYARGSLDSVIWNVLCESYSATANTQDVVTKNEAEVLRKNFRKGESDNEVLVMFLAVAVAVVVLVDWGVGESMVLLRKQLCCVLRGTVVVRWGDLVNKGHRNSVVVGALLTKRHIWFCCDGDCCYLVAMSLVEDGHGKVCQVGLTWKSSFFHGALISIKGTLIGVKDTW